MATKTLTKKDWIRMEVEFLGKAYMIVRTSPRHYELSELSNEVWFSLGSEKSFEKAMATIRSDHEMQLKRRAQTKRSRKPE